MIRSEQVFRVPGSRPVRYLLALCRYPRCQPGEEEVAPPPMIEASKSLKYLIAAMVTTGRAIGVIGSTFLIQISEYRF